MEVGVSNAIGLSHLKAGAALPDQVGAVSGIVTPLKYAVTD